MKDEKIIIGIDPGTNILGFGIISIRSRSTVHGPQSKEVIRNTKSVRNKNSEIEILKLDVLKLNHLKDHGLKLKKIFETLLALMEEYKPDEFAIEAPFFGKNVQSMLKLGRAQGVAMAAALHREIPITEYSPRKIKQAITGSGNASKEQVSGMLMSLLNIKDKPDYLDATDGLAVAVCHYFETKEIRYKEQNTGHKTQDPRFKSNGKKFSGWKAYVTENPKRVVSRKS